MSAFYDLFSGHASDYARFRPTYPPALFDWLASIAPDRQLAWDAATGNGQAAVELAARFERVIATDGSAAQLQQAQALANIEYRCETAEASTLDADSVDLVTVAQAIHWFQHDGFYAGVRRVLRPGGVLAVWCYETAHITPAVDAVVDRLYRDITGPYWEPQRRYIDAKLATLPFPFPEFEPTPAFACEHRWTLPQFAGYLSTWSANKKYMKVHGRNPLELVADDLTAAWGHADEPRRVVWPIHLRAGRPAE